jgi:CTP synthase
VRIALVGKYNSNSDAYASVMKSLNHAALAIGKRCEIEWVDAQVREPLERAVGESR